MHIGIGNLAEIRQETNFSPSSKGCGVGGWAVGGLEVGVWGRGGSIRFFWGAQTPPQKIPGKGIPDAYSTTRILWFGG